MTFSQADATASCSLREKGESGPVLLKTTRPIASSGFRTQGIANSRNSRL